MTPARHFIEGDLRLAQGGLAVLFPRRLFELRHGFASAPALPKDLPTFLESGGGRRAPHAEVHRTAMECRREPDVERNVRPAKTVGQVASQGDGLLAIC